MSYKNNWTRPRTSNVNKKIYHSRNTRVHCNRLTRSTSTNIKSCTSASQRQCKIWNWTRRNSKKCSNRGRKNTRLSIRHHSKNYKKSWSTKTRGQKSCGRQYRSSLKKTRDWATGRTFWTDCLKTRWIRWRTCRMNCRIIRRSTGIWFCNCRRRKTW
jgi:hypothetical protein